MTKSGPDSCVRLVSVTHMRFVQGFICLSLSNGVKLLHLTTVLFMSLITIQCQGRVCVGVFVFECVYVS